MEAITDVDYKHAKRVWIDFKIKKSRWVHDLYVQSDTLLLADAFESFGNKCTEKHELDPAHVFSPPGLAWQAFFKKTEIELELLTDTDMLLMVEKGIGGGICDAIYRYAAMQQQTINTWETMTKAKNDHILCVGMQTIWTEGQCLKLSNDSLKWKENTSKFDEKFIKSYDENSDKGNIHEGDAKYLRDPHDLHNILPLLTGKNEN